VLVVLATVLAAVLALWLAATRLGVNSDTVEMLDEELPFRQTWSRFREQFPNLDSTLLAVIEAPTPEQATRAAKQLRSALAERPDIARGVTWAAGSDFFAENGLLFLPLDELEALTDRLSAAQPMLGQLARDTRAATLLELLAEIEARGGAGALGLDGGDFDLDQLRARVAEVLKTTLDGQDVVLSWQQLLNAEDKSGPARETLIIDPVLDYNKVLAGRPVIEAMRGLRADLGLDRGPVRLALSGNVALAFEEMDSVISGARLTGLLALGLVSLVMLAGLRSPPLCLIALINLALGLALTAGFAAVAIGRVNMISVAFVVLYIGLGVNYAVHYLLRYREIAQAERNRVTAVIATGRFLWRPLLLSAATTALGFFAFVPTSFSGIAQLGLIAGVAMLVTLALSYTTLPAMLAWWRPDPGHRVPDPNHGWRRALDWPLRHRITFAVIAMLLLVAALPLASGIRFDADPLNLRDARSESVVTLRRLFETGDGGYRNIQVLLPPDEISEPLLEALRAQPAVARVVARSSFQPAKQDEKLLLIDDLGWLLGPDIVQADWRLDPPEPVRLDDAARRLGETLPARDSGGAALRQVLDSLSRRLADADPAQAETLAARVDQALVGGLAPTLGRLTRGLAARDPVSSDALPDWLARQFTGLDGTQLIQVFPAVDVNDFEQQRRFTEQVLEVAGPRATGGPVVQIAAADAITDAFRQAMLWAVLGISLVLLVTLRSVAQSARVLAPLALGGVLTGALMVLLDIPFNFANVVALPLLLGVAVDNGIHLVLRHRAGLLPDGNVLQSATARAIVFGALITAGGFGNLAFSPHAGTASLGLVLAMGLALMVLATLVFVPALLGRRAA